MRTPIDLYTLLQQLPVQKRKSSYQCITPDWEKEWERFDAKKLFNYNASMLPDELLAAMSRRGRSILDGNAAALSILTRIVDGLCGYPITPSTPIAENFAKAAAQGQKNIFGTELMYFQPSDELSAIAAVEAMACQGGRYVDNTSSQGLTLKTKNLFSVAGKRLPVVMTIMAREVSKGSISIHCGHSDFYAVRNTGWGQLVAQDNQELHELIPIAFKTAELRQVMLPFMVIGDGFVKSHALENIEVLSDDFLNFFVGPPNRLHQPDFSNPVLTGPFTDIDLTMEGQVSQDFAYRFLKRGVIAAMNMMNQLVNTDLKVVECYRTFDADLVIVIIGSGAGVVKDVIDHYRETSSLKIGLVRPVLFNPPCYEELAFGLRNAKVITVLERTSMSQNELLLADVQAALQISLRAGREGKEEHQIYGRDDMPTLLHGVYGLGSKDFNKYDVAAVIENMACCIEKKNEPILRDFYSGIQGPYTLAPRPLPGFLEKELGMTFIGIGAEGVKTSLETTALIYAGEAGSRAKFIQSGARYGAARKGSPVFMNLRIGSDVIRNASELSEHDVLVFFNEKFLAGEIMTTYVTGLNPRGLLLVNTQRNRDAVFESFPEKTVRMIKDRKIRLLTVDATGPALKALKQNLPGALLLGLINAVTGLLPQEDFQKRFKAILEKKLGEKKGETIVAANMALLQAGIEAAQNRGVKSIPGLKTGSKDTLVRQQATRFRENFGLENRAAGLPVAITEKDELGCVKPLSVINNYRELFYRDMVKPILDSKKVPWDRFLPMIPAATTQYRDMGFIGTQLPIWKPDNCIACGRCAVTCPDSALFATVTDSEVPEEAELYFKTFKKPPRGIAWDRCAMNINVIEDRCKGCGICARVCPVSALTMENKTMLEPADFLPEKFQDLDNTYGLAQTVDQLSLNHQILFVLSKLYPGKHTLCPGCSEGSISLFAFFALESLRNSPKGIETFYQGIKVLSDKNRQQIDHMIDDGFNIYAINATGCDEVSELTNPFNTRIYPSGHFGFGTASAAALGAKFSLDQAYGNNHSDVMTKIIVFAGDGAIYDIGNGPFNYALGENFDITWVIFNNEGYMNTGAQKSGATRFGCARSTSPIGDKTMGKSTLHRRIFSQATAISHVYAAKLSIDNPFFAIKILKEAIAYCGSSVVEFFSYCPQGHQGRDSIGPLVSRYMTESRQWQIQVRRPFETIDISANPEPKRVYPSSGKPFKKGVKRDAATFLDIVGMFGQYNKHIVDAEGEEIPDLVHINETVSLFRWLRNQYVAGYRESMPTEQEVEEIVKDRYRL